MIDMTRDEIEALLDAAAFRWGSGDARLNAALDRAVVKLHVERVAVSLVAIGAQPLTESELRLLDGNR